MMILHRRPKSPALLCIALLVHVGIAFLWIPQAVFSWLSLPPLSRTSVGARSAFGRTTTTLLSSAAPDEEVHQNDDDDDDDDDDEETERIPEDYTGKTIYQRTFYRLSSDSQVQLPNAMMIEERLRFLLDATDPEYMLPTGPRTLILREGTEEDDITAELFRIDLPSPTKTGSNPDRAHNGPRSLDNEIATILYLASNPKWIQGDVLELSCGGTTGASGVVGLLSCVASKLASMTSDELKVYKQERKLAKADVLALNGGRDNFSSVFPQGVHHLTLSDESPESLQGVDEMIQRHFRGSTSSPNVSVQQIEWSHPSGKRRYEREYRTVVGSDLDLSFPTAKELSKTVANILLPSNELAAANMKEGRPGIDPGIPATFVHLCPDYRDETQYLRQFLEKGHLMTVRTNYVSMERLQFYFQSLPQGSPESDLDQLDEMEVQEDISRDYQSMTAIHSPDYAGEGLGEYFFPLETGAYEGGLNRM